MAARRAAGETQPNSARTWKCSVEAPARSREQPAARAASGKAVMPAINAMKFRLGIGPHAAMYHYRVEFLGRHPSVQTSALGQKRKARYGRMFPLCRR